VIFELDFGQRHVLAMDVDVLISLIACLTDDQEISVYHIESKRLLWSRRLALFQIEGSIDDNFSIPRIWKP
jgi:hypothetical protein